jgi:polyisoprenoid-binding protein YceI
MRARMFLGATLLVGGLATATAQGADTYKVDAVHSSVVFRVKHMGVSYFFGSFDQVGGSFTLDPADPSKCQFDIEIQAGSVDTRNPQRDQHIKSNGFLNAAQYPKITFKSKSVSSAGKDTYEAKGDLTLHGVTKPVTIKIQQTGTGKGMRPGSALAGIYADFTIKRSDFGMKGMVGPVSDDVELMVGLEGGR